VIAATDCVLAYNERAALSAFAEITSDADLQMRLAFAYASPDDIELWVGGLAEDPLSVLMLANSSAAS
jgi:hypothetical protein